MTHVARGAFYGWPWFYIGGNQDPAHAGKHLELKNTVIVPDVLIQPYSASLGMTFYDGNVSSARIVESLAGLRARSHPHPLGEGEIHGRLSDFLTGFPTDGGSGDGSLLVTDDGARVIWRVSYTGK